jgi:hypothetical protein
VGLPSPFNSWPGGSDWVVTSPVHPPRETGAASRGGGQTDGPPAGHPTVTSERGDRCWTRSGVSAAGEQGTPSASGWGAVSLGKEEGAGARSWKPEELLAPRLDPSCRHRERPTRPGMFGRPATQKNELPQVDGFCCYTEFN